jgi:multidrug transporter EmrE-like cation transporter
MAYLLLAFSIISEVFGSTMLKLSDSYTKKLPVLGVIVGYALCFYLFSLALLELPLGFSYAVWSGLGTVLTAMVGLFLFKEKINRKGVCGISLVLLGVVLINLT